MLRLECYHFTPHHIIFTTRKKRQERDENGRKGEKNGAERSTSRTLNVDPEQQINILSSLLFFLAGLCHHLAFFAVCCVFHATRIKEDFLNISLPLVPAWQTTKRSCDIVEITSEITRQ